MTFVPLYFILMEGKHQCVQIVLTSTRLTILNSQSLSVDKKRTTGFDNWELRYHMVEMTKLMVKVFYLVLPVAR